MMTAGESRAVWARTAVGPGASSDGDRQLALAACRLDLATNEVRGVEGPVRWDHPTRGLLYPVSFLALAEDPGLMHAPTWPLTVAVNLSASSLVDADLPEQVGALLAARQLPADALQPEITEEFLVVDRDSPATWSPGCATGVSRSASTTSAPATARWPT